MIRLSLFIAIFLSSLLAQAQGTDLQDLYRQVDEAIDHSPEYVADYEREIAGLRKEYEQTTDHERKCQLACSLYGKYRSFLNDSAIAYLDRAEEHARHLRRPDIMANCRALKAFQCSTVGLYNEALFFLASIDKHQLDSTGIVNYYMAQMHVYGELGYYTQIPSMRESFFQKERLYCDSLYAVISHDSQDYMMRRISQLVGQKQWKEAIEISDKWMKVVPTDSRNYAIACYYRWLICNSQMQRDEANYWLAKSALSDVRNAVMDQASLSALAEALNEAGDYDRSYKYIRFTWECSRHFNTTMRVWQIAPILNVIDSNYKTQLSRNTSVLIGSIAVVSTLAFLLLGVLFFLRRRNKQLTTARQAIECSNAKLVEANSQLATKTGELSMLNARLSALNDQLSESNRVKEEYIGRFMSLCSQYINKLDDYRKMVNKKMKNKDLEELFRITKSTELKEKELEELYENFDSVFLHLFPNFIDDFNALLLPEAQIHLKTENRLTTDLRIFALIRLGIEDSSKIAEFLHYSVNTIYNYRARIKNGAKNNREDFENSVKNLGVPQHLS